MVANDPEATARIGWYTSGSSVLICLFDEIGLSVH